jgi:hypothetical protein
MYSDSDSGAAGAASAALFGGGDGSAVRDCRIAHPDSSVAASATAARRLCERTRLIFLAQSVAAAGRVQEDENAHDNEQHECGGVHFD